MGRSQVSSRKASKGKRWRRGEKERGDWRMERRGQQRGEEEERGDHPAGEVS